MIAWTKIPVILSLPLLLAGCIMSSSEWTQAHMNCGMGSAPIETYRSCLANAYQQNGGVDADRLQILLAADEAAESVRLGKMTRSEGYSYIAKIRGETYARDDQAQAEWFSQRPSRSRTPTYCSSRVRGNRINTNCY